MCFNKQKKIHKILQKKFNLSNNTFVFSFQFGLADQISCFKFTYFLKLIRPEINIVFNTLLEDVKNPRNNHSYFKLNSYKIDNFQYSIIQTDSKENWKYCRKRDIMYIEPNRYKDGTIKHMAWNRKKYLESNFLYCRDYFDNYNAVNCFAGIDKYKPLLEKTDNDVRKMLVFKGVLDEYNLKMKKQIMDSKNPVCLHIRFGDKNIFWNKFGENNILNYIKQQVSTFNSKDVDIFIFSDTFSIVKDEILPLFSNVENKIYLVEHNREDQPCEELELMRCCKHFISTLGGFCKLAYYLSEQKDKTFVRFEHH